MLHVLLAPFQVVGSLIRLAFGVVWSVVRLVFGILGGVCSVLWNLLVVGLIAGLIWAVFDKKRQPQEEAFTSFYDQR